MEKDVLDVLRKIALENPDVKILLSDESKTTSKERLWVEILSGEKSTTSVCSKCNMIACICDMIKRHKKRLRISQVIRMSCRN